MTLIETPALLILGTDQEYIERIRSEYSQPIVTPEGVSVIFFLRDDQECLHSLAGKNGTRINPFRAQRLLWIRFLLMNSHVREVKKSLQNGNIVFYCHQLRYIVVCSPTKKGLKYITQYIYRSDTQEKLENPALYESHILK